MSVARGFPNAGHYYSNIVKPIEIDCSFVVDAANTNGLGVRSVKSNGYVRNVFMNTSATPGSNNGYLNPNPAVGYALIQMNQNFNKFLGASAIFVSPQTGPNIPISGISVLTLGAPYVITAVGQTPAPKFTVVAVADVGGSLAGKYFTISDAFGFNYVLYNVVSGVGLPPSLTGPLSGYIAIPVAFATNSADTVVATAISNAIAALNNTNSFTTSVLSATVTVTSAAASTIPLPLAPNAQTSGFTVSPVVYTTIAADWNSVGLPMGLIPAVGQSFIATATGGALGSGTVQAPGASGISSVEVIGDTNQSIASFNLAANGGAWLMVTFLVGVTPTAPAANSVATMSIKFDGSNVTVDGL